MLNITELCKRFNQTSTVRKLPAHFLQLNQCKARFNEIQRTKGAGGGTLIPDDLGKLFTAWLSPEFNDRVYIGEDWREILKELK